MTHLLVLCFVCIALSVPVQPIHAVSLRGTAVRLQEEKLREEIKQLQLSNQAQEGLGGFVRNYGPLLTGVAAVLGALLAFWKYGTQRSDELNKADVQRKKEIEQRRFETDRQADEAFATVIAGLASAEKFRRVGAAVGLWTFLGPSYERYREQIYRLTLANLKLGADDEASRQLVAVFVRVMRLITPPGSVDSDLSHSHLVRADLSELQLHEFDFSYADLTNANLTDSQLDRSRGYKAVIKGARLCGRSATLETVRFRYAEGNGANFREARLVNAHFEHAQLVNAKFERATLQGAHFEHANLLGARFEQADIADARFTDATLDDVARNSILRARRWRGAHFSEAERDWFERADRNTQDGDPPNEER